MSSGDGKMCTSAPISGIHCSVCQMWTLVPGPENYSTFCFFLVRKPLPTGLTTAFHLLTSATMSMTGHTPTETNPV